MNITHTVNQQRTAIIVALLSEAGYEQRTSHKDRTPVGALDISIWGPPHWPNTPIWEGRYTWGTNVNER